MGWKMELIRFDSATAKKLKSKAKKWRFWRLLLTCLLDTRALPRWCNPMRNLQRKSLQDTANYRSATTQAQQARWGDRKTDGVASSCLEHSNGLAGLTCKHSKI